MHGCGARGRTSLRVQLLLLLLALPVRCRLLSKAGENHSLYDCMTQNDGQNKVRAEGLMSGVRGGRRAARTE